MADTLPTPADGRADNPFRAVAILLDGVRTALESSKRQDQAPRWVRVVRVREFGDDAIAQGIALFCAQGLVMPGIAVAGFVSAAPGLLQPVPLASTLEGIANGLLGQHGLAGEAAPQLGKALAQSVDLALTLFAGQMMVAPGIPCPPGASAGPGRLI